MKIKEKLGLAFGVTLFIIFFFFLFIPAGQYGRKERRLSESHINTYIQNSDTIYLENISKIPGERSIIYYDLPKRPQRKNISLIKDNNSGLYYRIESYDTPIWIQNNDIKNHVYLLVNTIDNNTGTEESPIIALKYYVKPEHKDYYIDDNEYRTNIKEYLVFKDYKVKSGTYHLFVWLITFSVTMGLIELFNRIRKTKRQT